MNAAGTALVYSTFLGGRRPDVGFDVAVDSDDRASVTGLTFSEDFPTTRGASDRTRDGSTDAFVATLVPAGTRLLSSTYLGGAPNWFGPVIELGTGIALDASGNAYVTGLTTSRRFPTTEGAFQTGNAGGIDAFVTKLALVPAAVALCVESPSLVGTDRADVLVGGPGDDVIDGRGGDDRIAGGGGDDVICGGDGDDAVAGGPGGDELLGQAGQDELLGGAGADLLAGGVGDDLLAGESGRDVLEGDAGDDLLDGGTNPDEAGTPPGLSAPGGSSPTPTDVCDGGFGDGDSAANCEIVTGVP